MKRSQKDKGKAPVLDMVLDSKSEPQVSDKKALGIFKIYAADTGFDNPRLAKTMLQANILRKDWEATKKCWLEDIFTSIYPKMLRYSFAHFFGYCY